ncbi:hypothetical protein NC652_002967 [Populus alba x Populus x berolinensis]|nr:hypothetical protein NC652_002967 [Populus alba x Populus x berolinensis]
MDGMNSLKKSSRTASNQSDSSLHQKISINESCKSIGKIKNTYVG